MVRSAIETIKSVPDQDQAEWHARRETIRRSLLLLEWWTNLNSEPGSLFKQLDLNLAELNPFILSSQDPHNLSPEPGSLVKKQPDLDLAELNSFNRVCASLQLAL